MALSFPLPTYWIYTHIWMHTYMCVHDGCLHTCVNLYVHTHVTHISIFMYYTFTLYTLTTEKNLVVSLNVDLRGKFDSVFIQFGLWWESWKELSLSTEIPLYGVKCTELKVLTG